MTKQELLNEIDAMIDEEISITNLQDDDNNQDVLNTLWTVKDLIIKLDD